MLDFLKIATRSPRRGLVEIYPKFVIKKSSDLMIRGGEFYAIWNEERGLWSTEEQDAIDLIDLELQKYRENYTQTTDDHIAVLYLWDSENGMIDRWNKYCKQQMPNNYHMLDEKLIFSNSETNKKDYASKRLNYPLTEGEPQAWNKLISTLYSPEERHKIEWAIGSIVSGASKKLQKFLVLYGAAGTGKSTILNVIQQLFDGYYCVFDAKALGSSGHQFALESFRNNPLVAIQHDGDLSRIEDNTRLNSLVSHELMTVNEKYTKGYENRFKCFLFMGTNKPVKITDGRSGLLRRLIDVTPSGNKLDTKEYKTIMKQVEFELGAIANHCQNVYLSDPGYYDAYTPMAMMGASNDFYNYVIDAFHIFLNDDGTTLKAAWEMYKTYCDEAKVPYPLSQRSFKEELKTYFREFNDRFNFDDGSRVRSYYSGFRREIFEKDTDQSKTTKSKPKPKLIEFDGSESMFDKACADCPAQYASAKETPTQKWEKVTSKLKELDTSKLHYVKPPQNHIVIDFDMRDASGHKSFEKNLEEASKWPATYAEVSKSGGGIHLHYIYDGDASKLSRVYDDSIEIKVFTGKSSLRRRLTKCNKLPVATISSGLPLKGETKVINFEAIKSEKALRTLIKRNLNKEIHPGTKPSIDFIFKILEDAYNGGLKYDVSDMYNAVLSFAMDSTNQAQYCIKLVNKMHFKSEDPSVATDNENSPLVFYDIEVFPNLFLVNWKRQGKLCPVVRMINPTSRDIEEILRFRLVGFNCRRYDNHILYGRLMGYNNEQLYNLSQKIIMGDRKAFFGEAYNISYTDVYDFASAGNKKSLKKFEIELGIHHKELGLPWDQPVPEEKWIEVAEYCDNDVIATEAVFDHLSADWLARQILADLAGMTVNDTTNSLTTKIIFDGDRKPQSQFNYRNLAEPVMHLDEETYHFLADVCPEMMETTHGNAGSLLPYFPGYEFKNGVSTYRGEEIGEGGYVYAEPGIHHNVALLDVASMHPHSTLAEALFGVKYSERFRQIVYGRVHIKHEDWEEVNKILDGKLTKYVQKVINGEMTSKQLADALKTAINSVYGLTAASFDNAFNDKRNKDNIVAKRGALFMTDLKYAVQERGFTVAHIKTDSIKIPNATPEIIQFVMDFGKRYGYTFEHEATYDKMCLVNDAVYIAKYQTPHKDKATGEDIWWTATGTQFAVPYVFKTLFSKQPIVFDDMCETKSVTSALYLKDPEIDPADNPEFVGRVGRFCPIKPGCGGKELLRESKDAEGNVKYGAAVGTKGYFWLESEAVKILGKEDDIDRSYYDKLVDAAVDTISKYGDFEMFVADHVDTPRSVKMPCGDGKYNTCYDCPHFVNERFDIYCNRGYDISEVVVKNN